MQTVRGTLDAMIAIHREHVIDGFDIPSYQVYTYAELSDIARRSEQSVEEAVKMISSLRRMDKVSILHVEIKKVIYRFTDPGIIVEYGLMT